jgi:5-methylcytosine-specific restriction endonuclease McrA
LIGDKVAKDKKKMVRAKFRNAVFIRDNFACKACGDDTEPDKLDAHHITDRKEMPFGGYVPENGISLCHICHEKAEVWHSSDSESFVEGFLPNDLYKLIDSSFEMAHDASLRLKE